mmetsp:Transcript_22565/g.47770  ORF Transcript_22565/g.47770 Transcript_22565/m.47770 type:complete len:212 (+) Transcript_22565:1027-1662(+)
MIPCARTNERRATKTTTLGITEAGSTNRNTPINPGGPCCSRHPTSNTSKNRLRTCSSVGTPWWGASSDRSKMLYPTRRRRRPLPIQVGCTSFWKWGIVSRARPRQKTCFARNLERTILPRRAVRITRTTTPNYTKTHSTTKAGSKPDVPPRSCCTGKNDTKRIAIVAVAATKDGAKAPTVVLARVRNDDDCVSLQRDESPSPLVQSRSQTA